jgi:hypothetical protein
LSTRIVPYFELLAVMVMFADDEADGLAELDDVVAAVGVEDEQAARATDAGTNTKLNRRPRRRQLLGGFRSPVDR